MWWHHATLHEDQNYGEDKKTKGHRDREPDFSIMEVK
jgi:hypothetical protein